MIRILVVFLTMMGLQAGAQQRLWVEFEDDPQAVLQSWRDRGATIEYRSRWFKAALVTWPADTGLPQDDRIANLDVLDRSAPKRMQQPKRPVHTRAVDVASPDPSFWGFAYDDLRTVDGDLLHDMGYRGAGVNIVVMDNGYWAVDSVHLAEGWIDDDRIRPLYDEVNQDSSVFDSGTHGSYVLSVMAVDSPGVFVGAAPDATYWLAITEDTDNEWRQEEINWLRAAERVDSLRQAGIMQGPVILTTSLGYSLFEDPAEDYVPADMDGNTTLITRASDRAASKGMLVVNSAGNSGDDDWRIITAPADGDSVLAVGAIGPSEGLASFSSRGPSADGRVKPDVVAPGAEVVGLDPQGRLVYINGTSFACPLIAGLAACLWQAVPSARAWDIHQAIVRAGHKAPHFDNDMGYGIPDFFNAWVDRTDTVELEAMDVLSVAPNPAGAHTTIYYRGRDDRTVTIRVIDVLGRVLLEVDRRTRRRTIEPVHLDTSTWPAGTYSVQVMDGDERMIERIVKTTVR